MCATEAEALAGALKVLEDSNDGDGWGIDEDQIASIVVGKITHRAVLHAHINETDEDELGVPPGEEVWVVKIEEVK